MANLSCDVPYNTAIPVVERCFMCGCGLKYVHYHDSQHGLTFCSATCFDLGQKECEIIETEYQEVFCFEDPGGR